MHSASSSLEIWSFLKSQFIFDWSDPSFYTPERNETLAHKFCANDAHYLQLADRRQNLHKRMMKRKCWIKLNSIMAKSLMM